LVGVIVKVEVGVKVGVDEGKIKGVSLGGNVAEGFSIVTGDGAEGAGVQVGGNWLIGVAVAVGNSIIARGVGGGKGLKGELGLMKIEVIAIPRHNVTSKATSASTFQKPSNEPRAARLLGAGLDLEAFIGFAIGTFPGSRC
jgi:hypothetical protein